MGPGMKSSLRVIIVNWNGGSQLARCLGSFSAIAGDDIALESVVVVDNGSIDDSIDRAATFVDQLPLRIVRNLRNSGFAAACNQGAKGSVAEFLLFLNPDTELRPGCLEKPAQFLADAANGHIGTVGITLLDGLGRKTRTCSGRPSLVSLIGNSVGFDRVLPGLFPPPFLPQHLHEGNRQVDQVMGAFFFVRRALFERLDGFDERFFMYFEDADFAMRAKELGSATAFLSTPYAIHSGHGSSDRVKAGRLFYFGRSRILFGLKHFGLAGGLAVSAATLLLEPVVRAGKALLTGQMADVRDVACGSVKLWGNFPTVLSRRATCDNA